MNDRVLSLLGLCRRAGRLTIGNDMVLVDKEEFEELKAVVTNDRDLQDFEEIVDVKEESNEE